MFILFHIGIQFKLDLRKSNMINEPFECLGNNSKCDICDKVFGSKSVLNVHNRIVHKTQEKIIPEIDITSKFSKENKNDLDQPKIFDSVEIQPTSTKKVEYMEEIKGKYRCDECNINYNRVQSYEKHIKFICT